MPKYLLTTFGCQMNVSDSERVAAVLDQIGYVPAQSEEDADLLLYNTCSVRQKAEDRIFGMHDRWTALKQQNPDLKIGLTGCMVAHGKYDFAKMTPTVDFVFKIAELQQLPAKLARTAYAGTEDPSLGCTVDPAVPVNDLGYFAVKPKITAAHQVTVPIMAGCDKFCTYCIVPFTRGRENSRSPDEIVQEVAALVNDGAREVMLAGQNVNSYIWCYPRQSGLRVDIARELLREKTVQESDLMRFAELLRRVSATPGLQRIRYMSPHPQDMGTDLITAMRDLPNVCEHVHLPLQAGSNTVLKAMHRTYTRERFMEIVDEIRMHMPRAAITTDTIVGFPGETEADFEQTVDIYTRARFDMAFIAMYSRRPGTVAADRMTDDVPYAEKKRRHAVLNSVLQQTSLANNQQYEDEDVEVLIEKILHGTAHGKTRTWKPVEFPASEAVRVGDLVTVRITRPREWTLEGALR